MADTLYDHTVLLLPLAGSNNAVEFYDLGAGRHQPVPVGNAKTVTSQFIHYGSSLYCDGAGDWVQVPGSPDFVFGTGPFSAECWLRTDGAVVDRAILDFYSSSVGWQIYITGTGKAQFYISGAVAPASTTSVNDAAWHHVAVTRSADGRLRVFVDGSKEADIADNSNLAGLQSVLAVGAQVHSRNAAYDYKGWVSDVRLTKGVCRYSDTFTPPGRLMASTSGVITDANGQGAARPVIAVLRDHPVRTFLTQSAANGAYTLRVPDAGEVSRIVLAQDAGTPGPTDPVLPDLIDRVIPG